MKKETDNEINAHVRKIYEPRYGKRLSDAEVFEIRTNLRGFAEGMVSIAERLYSQPCNSPEREGETESVEKVEST
jgi:hypothetical protein